MSHELFYTSAPRGLKPGSQGFCTVAQTRDLPAALAEWLEALSTFRLALPPDARLSLNPATQAHYRLAMGGREVDVLSYVCAAGLDYTQRHNKFAHHIVLEAHELPPAGPAWLLQQPGFLVREWEGEPRLLAAGRTPPRGDTLPSVCSHWQRISGDAGWAGLLAETFLDTPARPVYLLLPLGLDPLPLLAEAIGLLPVESRWEVTFSTYFVGLPQSVRCGWRCVLAGSPEAADLDRLRDALVLRLGVPLGRAPDSDLARQARSGKPAPARRRAPTLQPRPATPVRRPVNTPAYQPVETPNEEPLEMHEDDEPSPTPLQPPPRPRRLASSAPAPKLPAWVFGLLISLPLGIGAFAVGRAFPRQEDVPPLSSELSAVATGKDTILTELYSLDDKAKDVTRVSAVDFREKLEAARLTNLAKLLQNQENKLKALEEETNRLSAEIVRAKIDQIVDALK